MTTASPPRARRGDLRARRGRARPRLRAVVPQLRRPLRAAVGAGPRERALARVRGRLRAHPAPAADGVRAAGAAVRGRLRRRARVRDAARLRRARVPRVRARPRAVLAVGGPRGGARGAHAPALERDALLAYQDVPFAALVVGAVLLEARTRRGTRRCSRCSPSPGLLRPEAWVLSGLYVLWIWRDATTAAARDARRRARRRRAGDLGRLGLGRDRRPAALAARHRRPRGRQRPPPLARRRAVLDRAVLRLRAARAARARRPDRARVRLALRPPRAVLPLAVVARWSPCSRSARCSGCR